MAQQNFAKEERNARLSSYWKADRYAEYGLIASATCKDPPYGPRDVATVLDEVLARAPDSPALIDRHVRLSYRDLDARVNAAAAAMSALGVRPASRVAGSSINDSELVVAFLATQRLGAIWVGINRAYAAPEKRHLIEDSGATLFLCDAATATDAQQWDIVRDGLTKVETIIPGDASCHWRRTVDLHAGASRPQVVIDPAAPAAIAYTSGTTGFPKGVVHSQHNMIVTALISSEYSGDGQPETVRGTALPMTILNVMILGPVTAFATGASHVNLDRIDAVGVAEWIAAERINNINLVPTIVHDLLTRDDIDPADLDSVKWLVVGGSTVPKSLPELYRARFGKRMTVGYGLTEGPNGVAKTTEHSPDMAGVIGRPLPHLALAILDESGAEVPRGTVGEIAIRPTDQGPWASVYTPTLGYWRNAAATAKLLRGGWVHTGDIGLQDEDGEFHIRERGSDLILRGGANVYPAEVERVLRQHPQVRDCAVLGKPDERLGQAVVAFIEPSRLEDDGTSLTGELQALCEQNIARFKIPAEWFIVKTMPRNAMGKIVKGKLTARWSAVLKPSPKRGAQSGGPGPA